MDMPVGGSRQNRERGSLAGVGISRIAAASLSGRKKR